MSSAGHREPHLLSCFAAALLQHNLQTLHHHLQRLAQQRPDLLADVADHWDVSPTAAALISKVDRRAAALLRRRMDADHERATRAQRTARRAAVGLPPGPGHHSPSCSP